MTIFALHKGPHLPSRPFDFLITDSKVEEGSGACTPRKPCDLGIVVHFSNKAWDEEEELTSLANGKPLLIVPKWGWHDGIWYDGPVATLVDGRIRSCIPTGPTGTLYVRYPFDDGTGHDGGKEKEKIAPQYKISLLNALWMKFGPKDKICIGLETAQCAEAPLLVILRMAYPQAEMTYVGLPRDKAPQWKRLTQNLGIVPSKIGDASPAAQHDGVVILSVAKDLGISLKAEIIPKLVNEINLQSPVLPTSIF
jgi:hypothetical protein